MELNISADDVDRLVKDSIMQAGFGKAVTEGVRKALSGYNNPVDEALKRYVTQVANEIIEDKFAVEIRAAVQAVIEEKVTKELMNKTVSAAVDKMVSAAERY